MMDKPKKEDYGWEEPTLGEPGGWVVEGDETAYLEAYEAYMVYRLEKASSWRSSLGSSVLTKEEREWIDELRTLLERQPEEIYLDLDPGEKIHVRKLSRRYRDGVWRYDGGFEHTHIYVDSRFNLK